jgi:hypothetical protein
MHRTALSALALLLSLSTAADAAIISFLTDPFAGSTALTTPGRQIVGGEPSVSFSIANDVFAFDASAFGIAGPLVFANDTVGNLPTSGANVIVLQTLDDDANPATPFGAGSAANLLAAQITSPGAGFFVYFNQGLDLPRLVFSTDLSDNTSDLKILARMTNLTGAGGQNALPTFSAQNFAILPAQVPEPSTLSLLGAVAMGWGACRIGRRRRSA